MLEHFKDSAVQIPDEKLAALKDIENEIKQNQRVLSERGLNELQSITQSALIRVITEVHDKKQNWDLVKSVKFCLLGFELFSKYKNKANEAFGFELIEKVIKIVSREDLIVTGDMTVGCVREFCLKFFEKSTTSAQKTQMAKLVAGGIYESNNQFILNHSNSINKSEQFDNNHFESTLQKFVSLMGNMSNKWGWLTKSYFACKVIEVSFSNLKDIYSRIYPENIHEDFLIFQNEGTSVIDEFQNSMLSVKENTHEILKQSKFIGKLEKVLLFDSKNEIPVLYTYLQDLYNLLRIFESSQIKLNELLKLVADANSQSQISTQFDVVKLTIEEMQVEMFNQYVALLVHGEFENLDRYNLNLQNHYTSFHKFSSFFRQFIEFNFAFFTVIYILTVDMLHWNQLTERRVLTEKIESLDEYFDFLDSKSASLSHLKEKVTLVAGKLLQIVPPKVSTPDQEITLGQASTKDLFEI
jgi:hypothetical protein